MTPNNVVSSLKIPCIAAVVVVLVLWSLLSLDRHANRLQTTIIQYKDGTSQVAGSDGVVIAPATPENPVLPTQEPSNTQLKPSTEENGGKPVSDRPLILYAYSESDFARINIAFFIKHGLHGAADFIFIINGESDVTDLIPTDKENIRTIERPNECFDLGAYAEVLLKDDMYKGYKRFITMNASIRGPFVPYWANACWSDMYLNKLTDEIKLVGMTANCWPTWHIQSMIWATDIIGIEVLLHPPQKALDYLVNHPILLPYNKKFPPDIPATDGPGANNKFTQLPGINGCFENWAAAVAAEVSSTSVVKAAGYKVDVLMGAYHGDKNVGKEETCKSNFDVLWDGMYWGTNVHPFETLFIKSHRDVDEIGLNMQTKWLDGREYSSWDVCK